MLSPLQSRRRPGSVVITRGKVERYERPALCPHLYDLQVLACRRAADGGSGSAPTQGAGIQVHVVVGTRLRRVVLRKQARVLVRFRLHQRSLGSVALCGASSGALDLVQTEPTGTRTQI